MNIIEFLQTKHNIILNDQQQKGVLCIDKNTLLLAVPGSGKTTVLVSRIANLIINYKVNGSSILTLTYSKETAKDMKRRYTSLFNTKTDIIPEFKTIHSFCFMVLSHYAKVKNRVMPKLISDSQINGLKTRVLREIYMKHNEEYLADDMLETLDRQISYTKNMMLSLEQMIELEKEVSSFVKIFADYEAFKKKNGLIDYDDMLTYTYDIFTKLPDVLLYFNKKYKYINVDEAQDTSLVQHKIIGLLAKDNSVFMVGDEDQSIYSFRGAYPKALLDFNSLYDDATIIKMEQNFRSNKDIVAKSNEFIKQNKQRYKKEMYCNNENDKSIKVTLLKDFSEQYQTTIDYIKSYPKDKTLAIIYRNNESAIPIIDLLYKNNLNFYIKEHKLTYFTSFVMRDIVAYIMLSIDQTDTTYFKQIYYKMGLSKGVFEYVEKNIGEYDSVFSCAASLVSLSDYKKNQMKYYNSGFKRLTTMNPTKAIDYILDTLGYRNYIDNRLNDGFTKTNTYQKINTAICLADGVKTTQDFLEKLNDLQVSLHENRNIDKSSNITLTTLHSSKGLEYDTVIMLDMIKDIIPTSDAVNSQLFGELDAIENETRLFYVGVTRAKTKLIIYKSHFLNGNVTLPSRFVDKLINDTTVSDKQTVKSSTNDMIIAPPVTGKTIKHSTFGKGIIEMQEEDILTVSFIKCGIKNISYSACMNAELIEIL